MIERNSPPLRILVEVDEADFISKLQQWREPALITTFDPWDERKELAEPYTYFWVGKQEAFGRRKRKGEWVDGWGDAIPPAVFARFGLGAVQRAWVMGTAELPLDEEGDRLTFRREGDQIAIRGAGLHPAVLVPYEPLLTAWQTYNERIREIMRQHDPDFLSLKRHNEYGSARLPYDYDVAMPYDENGPTIEDWEWGLWDRWLRGEDLTWRDAFPAREYPDYTDWLFRRS